MANTQCKLLLCGIIIYIVGNLLYYGGTEYYRARTYIKNLCQVTKSDIDDSSCGEDKDQDCYQPVWAVLYDKPDIDDKPVEGEIHSKDLLSRTQANTRVDQYQVDQIYTCFHNKAQNVVQWETPNKRGALIQLVLGLLMVPVVLGCGWLYYLYRKRNQEDNATSNPVASADGDELENMATAEDDPAKSSTAV